MAHRNEIVNALQQLHEAGAQEDIDENDESSSKDELIRALREKNSELVQELQHLKMTMAAKDKERMELLKDNNELRLKLSRLRSTGAALDSKLKSDLAEIDEQLLGHLLQATGVYHRSIEVRNRYLSDRAGLVVGSTRAERGGAEAGGGSPGERVRRVPPLLYAGHSIQPVVSLSRTMLGARERVPEQNNEPPADIPIHLMQDAYIRLQRLDLGLQDLPNGFEERDQDDGDRSEDTEQDEQLDNNEISHITEEDEDVDDSSSMRIVDRNDNPLEGPSWLLHNEPGGTVTTMQQMQSHPEADSTTGCNWPQGEETAQVLGPPSPVLPPRTPLRPPRTPAPPLPPTPRFSPTLRRKRLASATVLNDSRELRVIVTDIADTLTDSGGGAAGGGAKRRRGSSARSPLLNHSATTPQGAAITLSRSPSPAPAPRQPSPSATFTGFDQSSTSTRARAKRDVSGSRSPSPAPRQSPSEVAFTGFDESSPSTRTRAKREVSGWHTHDPDYEPNESDCSSSQSSLPIAVKNEPDGLHGPDNSAEPCGSREPRGSAEPCGSQPLSRLQRRRSSILVNSLGSPHPQPLARSTRRSSVLVEPRGSGAGEPYGSGNSPSGSRERSSGRLRRRSSIRSNCYGCDSHDGNSSHDKSDNTDNVKTDTDPKKRDKSNKSHNKAKARQANKRDMNENNINSKRGSDNRHGHDETSNPGRSRALDSPSSSHHSHPVSHGRSDSRQNCHDNGDSRNCHDNSDSDASSASSLGARRRQRKPIVYKEMPLNRKMRR